MLVITRKCFKKDDLKKSNEIKIVLEDKREITIVVMKASGSYSRIGIDCDKTIDIKRIDEELGKKEIYERFIDEKKKQFKSEVGQKERKRYANLVGMLN